MKKIFSILALLVMGISPAFASRNVVQGEITASYTGRAGWAIDNPSGYGLVAVKTATPDCGGIDMYNLNESGYYTYSGTYDTGVQLSNFTAADFKTTYGMDLDGDSPSGWCVYHTRYTGHSYVLITQHQNSVSGSAITGMFGSLRGTTNLTGATLHNFLISPDQASRFQIKYGYYPWLPATSTATISTTGSWYFNSMYNSVYWGFPQYPDSGSFWSTDWIDNTNDEITCDGGGTCHTSRTSFVPAVVFIDSLADLATDPFSTTTGGGDTWTDDFTLTGSSTMFSIASTTIAFGTPDLTPCDITAVSFSLTSFIDFGTFSIPSCALEATKYVLFGSSGISTAPIIEFTNNASSTLPFTLFRFIGSGLVFIDGSTGNLQNLPTSGNVYSIPITASSSVSIDIQRATSTPMFAIDESIDKTISTVEWLFFFLVWGLLARKMLL